MQPAITSCRIRPLPSMRCSHPRSPTGRRMRSEGFLVHFSRVRRRCPPPTRRQVIVLDPGLSLIRPIMATGSGVGPVEKISSGTYALLQGNAAPAGTSPRLKRQQRGSETLKNGFIRAAKPTPKLSVSKMRIRSRYEDRICAVAEVDLSAQGSSRTIPEPMRLRRSREAYLRQRSERKGEEG